MKFLIRKTNYAPISKKQIPDIVKENGSYYIEINTLEELLELEKTAGHNLIISSWAHLPARQKGVDGSIEIYNDYRE